MSEYVRSPKRKTFPALCRRMKVDQDKALANKRLEKELFAVMTAMYCRACGHQGTLPLSSVSGDEEVRQKILASKRLSAYRICPDCRALIEEAYRHTARCPHSLYKTFCHECPTPCYRPDQLERIVPVMKMAGPGLIRRHPYLAGRFVKNLWAAKRLIRRLSREDAQAR